MLPYTARSVAPVAQLDRAPDYESGGWKFESFRARHLHSRASEDAPGVGISVPDRAQVLGFALVVMV